MAQRPTQLSRPSGLKQAISHRDAILEAVSYSAEEFMKSADLDSSLRDMLERIGKAADVSRAYIFKDDFRMDGHIYTSQVYEWVAEGVTPQINNPALQNLDLDVRYPEETKKLIEGEYFITDIHGQPEFVEQGIQSMIAFPILVEHNHWGFIGFDDCTSIRHWELPEIRALQIAAGILGAAIERRQFEQALEKRGGQLRALSQRLVDAQERERRFIALELHDEIGQTLTGIKLTLQLALKLPDSQKIHEQILLAEKQVDDLTFHVKDISQRLRPPILDDLGLLPALLMMFQNYTQQTQIPVHFQHSGITERRFNPQIEINLYRIIQEALTNAARYSGSQEAAVRIWANPHTLGVQIEDYGKGFEAGDQKASRMTTGLIGMQERAASLRGHLTLETGVGAGTRLTVEIPLSESITCL